MGLKNIGTATALSVARGSLAATTLGNYALFGGGLATGYSAVVDAYDTSLTRSTPTALSFAREYLSATTVGNYALFGGGEAGSYSAVVDAYDTSLTRTTPTALSVARRYMDSTTIGDYALFGGGYLYNTVDAYDTSLTRTTPTALSVARSSLAATTLGDYALFGGGCTSDYALPETVSAVIDAYNISLTRSTPTTLSVARTDTSATMIDDYALFGGGFDGTAESAVVDAYDASLTRSTPTALSVARRNVSTTTTGDYALFGGGYGGGASAVDAYDSSLTRSTPTPLSVGRYDIGATTIGDYALFGGGYSITTAVVDVYAVVQTAIPSSDITTGWTPSTGTTLYGCIDEEIYSDADYIRATGVKTCEVKLSSTTDPVSSTGHIVRFRAKATGSSGAESMTVTLYQGTTSIAVVKSGTITRSTFNPYTLTLSAAQADAITNYGDLRLRFVTTTIGTTETIDVSWAEMQLPASPTVTNEGVSALSVTSILTATGSVTKVPVTQEGASNLITTSILTVVGSGVHAIHDGAIVINSTSVLTVISGVTHIIHSGETTVSVTSISTITSYITHTVFSGEVIITTTSELLVIGTVVYNAPLVEAEVLLLVSSFFGDRRYYELEI